MKLISLEGKYYGDWFVIRQLSSIKNETYWECKCVCGIIKRVCARNLRNGKTRGCGCRAKIGKRERATSHGLSHTREYSSWSKMKSRCSNPNSKDWKDYGGRGIGFCKEWECFDNFLSDMGRIPKDRFSLGRIDNNQGYSSENCRWESIIDQANNKRSNHFIHYNGEIKTIAEWARDKNIPFSRLERRINLLGWSVDRALTT